MLIPATTGEFGVLPGHVPTVAQLKPGVLAVHLEADKNVKKARARLWSWGRVLRCDTRGGPAARTGSRLHSCAAQLSDAL